MSAREVLHAWRNALHGITLAMEYLTKLEPTATPEEIEQARELDALAWQQLTEAHAAALAVILRELGL